MGLSEAQRKRNEEALAEAIANQAVSESNQEASSDEEGYPAWVTKAFESGSPSEKKAATEYIRLYSEDPSDIRMVEYFVKSLRQGWKGNQISFGQTRQLVSEDEERAEKIEPLQDEQEVVYESKYGEEGGAQFKNLEDPNWWAKSLGEGIAGSLPFFTGIGAGGGAGFLAAGPAGVLPGMAIGGGLAVYAQSFGPAYYEYLEAHPGDEQGAEDYAIMVSGLSSVISAASVPFSLAGKSTEPIKKFIIQSMLQGGLEAGDNISGNLLAREYVDPNRDPFTGLASGLVSEVAFESPTLYKATTSSKKRQEAKKVREATFKDKQEQQDKALDLVAETKILDEVMTKRYNQNKTSGGLEDMTRIRPRVLKEIQEGNFASLDIVHLKEIADKLKINFLPIDNAETLFNKIKQEIKANAEKITADNEAKDIAQSELTFEDRFNEQKDILEGLSGQQVFDYIQREFDMGSPERTWEQFSSWAERQGDFSFSPAAFESEYYNNQKTAMESAYGSQIINALAHASATRLHSEHNTGAIAYSLGGKGEFRDHVEEISNRYTRRQLEDQYRFLYTSGSPTDQMSNTDLAGKVAEKMMILENARMKKKKSVRSVDHTLADTSLEGKGFEANPNFIREVSPDGNAYKARAVVYGEDGKEQGTIFFQREYLKEPEFNNLLDRAGVERDFSAIEMERVKNLGRLVAVNMESPFGVKPQFDWQKPENWKGMTIDTLAIDPLSSIPNIKVTQLSTVGTAMPQYQRGFFKKGVGKISSWFRPAGRLGSVTFHKKKQVEAYERQADRDAKNLANDVEVAIINAAKKQVLGQDTQGRFSPKNIFRWKKYLAAEKDIRNKVSAFLRKTTLSFDANPQQRAAIKKEINRLETNMDKGIVSSPEQLASYEAQINELKLILAGSKPINVAIQELPTKALRKAMRNARSTIDAFSKRLLNELPAELLGDKDGEKGAARTYIEDGLGAYTTSSYGINEPGLNFAPKFSMKFLGSKSAQKLFKAGVISFQEQNRGDPDWQGEKGKQKAIDAMNDLWSREQQRSTMDTQILPGTIKGAYPNEKGQSLPTMSQMLQQRKKIPFALRKAMGEVTDPTLLIASTISRVSRVISRQNYYRDLLNTNFMPGEQMFSITPIGPFTEPIAQDDANPLSGLFTTPDFSKEISAQMISEATDMSPMIHIWKSLAQIKGGVQGLMIILSPGTQMRNLTGAGLMFANAGHLTQGDWAASMRMINTELFPRLAYDKDGNLTGDGTEARENMRLIARLGVTSTNPNIGDAFGISQEMASGRYTKLDEIVHALMSTRKFSNETLRSTAVTGVGAVVDKTVGAVWRKAKAFYMGIDDFFKRMAWGANVIEIKNSLNRFDEIARNLQPTDVTPSKPVLGTELIETAAKEPVVERLAGLEYDKDGKVLGVTDEWKLALLREYSSTLTMNMGTYRSDAAILYRNVDNLSDYIKHLAAHLTRNTMPNYDYVGAFAKTLRLLPFGNFIAFDTEMIRVTGNLIQLQYKDAAFKLSDKLMLQAGLPKEQAVFNAVKDSDGNWQATSPYVKQINQRPFHRKAVKRAVIGNLAMVGLVPAIIAGAKALYDVDDEELEAADKIGPEYAKGSSRAPTSGVKDGKMKFILLDYIIPTSFLFTARNIILQSTKDSEDMNETIPEAAVKGVFEAFFDFMETYYQISIAAATSSEIILNRNKNGKDIYNETDDLGEILKVVSKYILTEAGPGGYRQMRDVYKAFARDEDLSYTASGKKIEKIPSALKVVGFAEGQVDGNEGIGYKINDITNITTGSFKKDVAANLDTVRWNTQTTSQDILDQWTDAQVEWFNIQKQLYFDLQAYEKMDTNPKKIKEALSRLGNLPGVYTNSETETNITNNLKKGIFTPWKMPNKYKKTFNEIKRDKNLKRVWPQNELKTRYKLLKGISLREHSSLPLAWQGD